LLKIKVLYNKIQNTMFNIDKQLCHSRYLILSLCYVGIVFFLSSLPESSLTLGDSNIERFFWNFAHIPLYCGLTIFLFLTFKNKRKTYPSYFHATWRIILIPLCIAVVDELNQATVHNRSSSLLDIMLDVIGIITALLIISLFNFKTKT
jgi:VanZ family protein